MQEREKTVPTLHDALTQAGIIGGTLESRVGGTVFRGTIVSMDAEDDTITISINHQMQMDPVTYQWGEANEMTITSFFEKSTQYQRAANGFAGFWSGPKNEDWNVIIPNPPSH